jgi:hypothetical protein
MTTLAPNSIDDDSRMRDFLARHGGAFGADPRRGETIRGRKGWSEVTAVDGYVLRCDWEKRGDQTEMRYEEHPPQQPVEARDE